MVRVAVGIGYKKNKRIMGTGKHLRAISVKNINKIQSRSTLIFDEMFMIFRARDQ